MESTPPQIKVTVGSSPDPPELNTPPGSPIGLVPRRTPLDESHVPKSLRVHTGSYMKNLSATELAESLKDVVSLPRTTIDHKQPSQDLPESRVLVLYTGGTIGMRSHDGVYSPEPGYLPEVLRGIPPLNDRTFIQECYPNATVLPYALPPVRHMKKRVVYWIVEYEPLLDSCDMTFDDWIRIASDIRKAYHQYDGFVVLHGTDTLAYTASALSFMMENLGKPVIITGSQIPVAEVRSDGMENLIGALITAGNFDIPEVCVYFNNKLFRGNRTTKLDNSALEAFNSPNMHPLASMNINIKVNFDNIFRSDNLEPFAVSDTLCRDVGMLRIFPSMSIASVKSFLQAPTKGVILQTFGAGNMPTKRKDILEAFKDAIDRGVIILNCSQCLKGQVDVNYVTGKVLYDIGVIPGSDMTSEAAMAKMCYVLGKDEWDLETKKKMMLTNLRGELTITRNTEFKELEIIPHIARYLRCSSSHEVKMLRDALLPPLVCHAAKNGNVELLASLKESGAVFSTTDYSMRSALHVAAATGHIEAVHYLLRHGASVHAKDHDGMTPLMTAIRNKHIDCVEAIHAVGGTIEADATSIGMQLCLAAANDDLATLKAFQVAGCSLQHEDYDGRTALHVAVSRYRPDCVKFLIEQGMDPHRPDDFGLSSLQYAANKGHKDLVHMMQHILPNDNNHVFNMDDH